MYQFVRALKNKDIVQFKKQFRSVDVLMVDDVQFICGKDSTQEEFFHTFNALIENNCQLVISGDRSPSDLDGMEDRIKSRLGWGLVADVHATNYELRLGILESKMEILGVQIPRDVLEFLAQRITANVRELEGALHKIVAHMTLMSAPMTLSLAQHVLRDLLRTTDRSVSLEMIQKTVSDYFRIKLSELVAGGRHRAIARPRQMAMYLCKQWTSKSLSEIGDRFGGKDHTTVMHAIRKVEELMSDRGEFYDDIRRIEQRLQGVN
jgi:chromosomal replication initiator protein